MYKDKKIGVVIPAFNEEKLISKVITTMPDFVDCIIVVDDASTDRTSQIVQEYLEQFGGRLILIRFSNHVGKGGAIISGHQRAIQENLDAIATMDGDAQMDPEELPDLLDPVVSGTANFSKGNRFVNREAWNHMPKVRYFANAALSLLNKIATGYWHVADPQCGYTVISRSTLQLLDLQTLSKDYHFENSLLLHLHTFRARVVNVPVRAIYGIGEKSGINQWWALFSFSFFLLGSFVWRLKEQYIIRNFHPLIVLYFIGFFSFLTGFGLGLYLVIYHLFYDLVQKACGLFAFSLLSSGLLLLIFAMWSDKEYQR